MAIQSFKNKDTQALFEGKEVKKFTKFRAAAERKLQLLDSAASLGFLRHPPGNHLKPLVGDRKGEHSIRINGQYI